MNKTVVGAVHQNVEITVNSLQFVEDAKSDVPTSFSKIFGRTWYRHFTNYSIMKKEIVKYFNCSILIY